MLSDIANILRSMGDRPTARTQARRWTVATTNGIETNRRTEAQSTRSGTCGKGVGLLWVRGRSTLVESQIAASDENPEILTVRVHRCLPPPTRSNPRG